MIEKWHRLSGPEWTTNRLKSLELYSKQRFLDIKNGVKITPIPLGWAVISSRQYPKRFKDDLLHEIFSSKNFDLEKALHFCRLSSSISLFNKKNNKVVMLPPTKTQLNKFLTAIEGPVTSNIEMHLDDLSDYLVLDAHKYYNWKVPSDFVPMLYQPLSEKSAPFYDEYNRMVTSKRNSDTRCWNVDVLYTYFPLMEFLHNNIEYVSSCIIGDGDFLLPKIQDGSLPFKRLAGTISPIQELGCKLRPAANPMLCLQAINEPLKVILEGICKRIDQIVTFDQDYGRNQLYNWIKDGEEVWSYDASSFTDRFPRDFQMEVLKRLLQHNVITKPMYEAFDITTQMDYMFEPIGRSVSYKYGQPQGLGPSFHLATLAHYELLLSITRFIGLPSDTFLVLGDDVIIKDPILAYSYKNWMESCNVEINLQKSVISPHLGEFAGANITSDYIIKRVKLGKIKNNDTVVSWFDLHMESKLPNKFLKFMFEEHASLVQKMSIPNDFGGRREQTLQIFSEYTLPLDPFITMKKRILKDLNNVIYYDPKSVQKFLENKEFIKTGIIDSLNSWTDNPGFVRNLDQQLSRPNKLDRYKYSSVIQRSQINYLFDTILEVRDEIRQSDDPHSLLVIINSNKEIFNFNGYLKDITLGLNLMNDPKFQMSKVIGKIQTPTKVFSNTILPQDTSWGELLINKPKTKKILRP
jgi:hypothetical protein